MIACSLFCAVPLGCVFCSLVIYLCSVFKKKKKKYYSTTQLLHSDLFDRRGVITMISLCESIKHER